MSSVLLSHYPLLLSSGLLLELTGVARLADQQDHSGSLPISTSPKLCTLTGAHFHNLAFYMGAWHPDCGPQACTTPAISLAHRIGLSTVLPLGCVAL